VPRVSEEVEKEATPDASVAMERILLLSRNVTVPEGVPVLGAAALTVTVRVTVWPKMAGFADEVRTTEVFAALTMSDCDGDCAPLKLASPA
jgi:hypothetical protein